MKNIIENIIVIMRDLNIITYFENELLLILKAFLHPKNIHQFVNWTGFPFKIFILAKRHVHKRGIYLKVSL